MASVRVKVEYHNGIDFTFSDKAQDKIVIIANVIPDMFYDNVTQKMIRFAKGIYGSSVTIENIFVNGRYTTVVSVKSSRGNLIMKVQFYFIKEMWQLTSTKNFFENILVFEEININDD